MEINMNEIFEYATRHKLRFAFKGVLSVEDLWDLNPESLDNIYTTLVREQRKHADDSLLTSKSDEDTELLVKIDIVRYIFETKESERKAREAEAERSAQKQRILGIIADKQDAELKNMSVEELQAKLNELN